MYVTPIAFLGLFSASLVSANFLENPSGVYYCKTTAFAETFLEGVQQVQIEEFKISVDKNFITFAKGGYFDGLKVPVTHYSFFSVKAQAETILLNLNFETGGFNWGQVTNYSSTSITAKCDRF